MVGVEAPYVLIGQVLFINRVQIDGREGERFKVQELSKLVFLTRAARDKVLCAHAVGSGNVNARLVAYDHARLDHTRIVALGHHVPAETDRRLVYTQKAPYAVARAVFVIKPLLPKQPACQNVEVHAARTV